MAIDKEKAAQLFVKELEKLLPKPLSPDLVRDEAITGQPTFYNTGARALIKIGGRPLGVCQDFRWSVSYQGTPIQTIDTVIPWDIDIGQVSISAQLTNILDPTKGPEVDGLFSTMSAAIHQPIIEIQVQDKKDGDILFTSRGMFISVDGSLARGQLSTISAKFLGISYQHHVRQRFTAYSNPF